MSLPVRLRPDEKNSNKVPVMGISEWEGYFGAGGAEPPSDASRVFDECIDAHTALGIDQIVWEAGRSTLEYWSDLPNVTQSYERSTVGVGKSAGISWEFVASVKKKMCPLRYAIKYCHERNIPLLGRLAMNRHYSEDTPAHRSLFASENPDFQERTKLGNVMTWRLCYALEEVRQERIDILLEVQRIGVDALVLDFCRQMPILMYHDALVEPFMKTRGYDPRQVDSPDPDDYKEWFQYRADVLTAFMVKLREGVRRQEKELGNACPVIARIPDSAPWLMIAYGLDIERWCEEDLVDATMLSPFPRCIEDLDSYPEYHVSVAHKHGKACIGGIGSRNLMKKGEPNILRDGPARNTGFFHPKPVFKLAERQYKAGVDSMSLYETEMLTRIEYLQSTLKDIGDKELVSRKAAELPDPETVDEPVGVDWHSKFEGRESLQAKVAGDNAL